MATHSPRSASILIQSFRLVIEAADVAQRTISRRGFIKEAMALVSSGFISSIGINPIISFFSGEPAPMTDLILLRTRNTPLDVVYLDRFGEPEQDTPVEHKTLSDIIVDLPLTAPQRRQVLFSERMEYNPKTAMRLALPHITGCPQDFYVLLDLDTILKGQGGSGDLILKNDSGIISTYAYSDQRNINPNKIWNVLTGLSALAKWQRAYGPMEEDFLFSFLTTTNAIKRAYLDYQPQAVYGGGICAIVSTLSKAQVIASAQGATEEVYRSTHSMIHEYWATPREPGITKQNSDATTAFEIGTAISDRRNVDYKFRVLDGPLYLSIRAFCEYDDKPIRDDMGKPADARLTFSITMQRIPPAAAEYEGLRQTLDDYAHWHGFSQYDLGRIHRKD